MKDGKPVIAGIDEAGRGAVIGPLVIVGLTIHPEDEKKLKDLGVRDSKELTPKRREALAEKIEGIAKDIIVLKVEACKIDTYRKEGVNLNKLEALKFGEILNFLEPDRAYIDAIETVPEKLRLFISKMLKKETELIVEHRADSTYLVVGAASIIAKVSRDQAVRDLEKKYGKIGSGYPSDPFTVKWLRDWMESKKEFPDCVRRTWMTIESLEKEKSQSRLGKWLRKK